MDILEVYNYQELKKSGFTYKYYENPSHYEKGMAFFYKGKEWVYGGKVIEQNKQFPVEVQEGIWLPDESYLLRWLEENDFTFFIKYDSLYRVEAIDEITQAQYRANGANLSQALAYLITKIYKKGQRLYDNKQIERFEIIEDED